MRESGGGGRKEATDEKMLVKAGRPTGMGKIGKIHGGGVCVSMWENAAAMKINKHSSAGKREAL